MFIETNTGRLQNLYLLQDVQVKENENKTFSIGYVQSNGVIIKEGEYATKDEAETERKAIVAKLLITEDDI